MSSATTDKKGGEVDGKVAVACGSRREASGWVACGSFWKGGVAWGRVGKLREGPVGNIRMYAEGGRRVVVRLDFDYGNFVRAPGGVASYFFAVFSKDFAGQKHDISSKTSSKNWVVPKFLLFQFVNRFL